MEAEVGDRSIRARKWKKAKNTYHVQDIKSDVSMGVWIIVTVVVLISYVHGSIEKGGAIVKAMIDSQSTRLD